ncbi:hypothetical protein [Metapseudomonas otitidis]|uniref:hypothetical protein n=1 Tax=Metapseudomonas otitidis TaxID=319939 RepID=UPI0013F68E17|nr:hypothetical protein [Pseudomonas otitidis]
MRKSNLLIVTLITGCAQINEKIEKNAIEEFRKGTYSSEIIATKVVAAEDLETLLKTKVSTKEERNEIQGRLLTNSEVNCGEFIDKTHMGRAALNVVLGTYANAASTAAAIVSGRAGQNLAGVSSVLGYYGNTFNQEVYSGILMPSLTGEIMSRREEMDGQIRVRQTKSLSEYPYQIAIMDAIRFHNLCSIPVALVRLINKKDSAKQIDYSAAIENIDSEIEKQKALLKSSELALSSSDENKLREQIMDLTKRREILSTSLLQTIKASTNTDDETPPPATKSDSVSETSQAATAPSTTPISIVPSQ